MKRLKTRDIELFAYFALLGAACTVFTVWPDLDLAIARWFYEDARFVGNGWVFSVALDHGMPWFGAALLLWSAFVLVHRWRGGAAPRPVARRAALLLLVSAFGVGVAVNMVLKEHWGRPRPSQVTAFHGQAPFQPALRVSGVCPHNCSFVSGHAAGGFALLVLGALGARRTRWRWWLVGTATGTAVGIGRMSQGSHFASDIVFALLVVWAVAIAVRTAIVYAGVLRLRRRCAAPVRGAAARRWPLFSARRGRERPGAGG